MRVAQSEDGKGLTGIAAEPPDITRMPSSSPLEYPVIPIDPSLPPIN
jgi:hypothetical protein